MIKCSNFDVGIKVTVFESKYTGSSLEISFLSHFARCSHSCFVTFLFREVDAEEQE